MIPVGIHVIFSVHNRMSKNDASRDVPEITCRFHCVLCFFCSHSGISCIWSPEACGVVPPDAASASFGRLVSTTTPSTIVGTIRRNTDVLRRLSPPRARQVSLPVIGRLKTWPIF